MISTIEQEIINHGGIENYLYAQQHKMLLRFLTCGSVDDGKSTLIGRLLHDSYQIYDDQLSVLHMDSKKIGTQKNKLDLALLVDGLQSERAQGITIDVAYRYFFTKKRKFIIADTPGHIEYTKNMVTGASTSELAILLVDARKGIQSQTKRHWFITVLLGIQYIIVAINKMDLINYNQKIFEKISKEYLEFAKKHLPTEIHTIFIPISAVDGDNVATLSTNMKWYNGPTLLEMLEDIHINDSLHFDQQELRFPVQYVIRHNLDFRGYVGTIASGSMHVGQRVNIFPSNTISTIKRIIKFNADQTDAGAREAVAITLEDDIDVSRGDMIIDSNTIVTPVQNALVDVVWMKKEALKKNQYFNVKIATKVIRAQVKNIEYEIDINTLQSQKTNTIPLNGIGLIKLLFDEPLILDQYSHYPTTGSMIFIDLLTNETVGAGMVRTLIAGHKLNDNKNYSEFELAFHEFIRFHFPHWNVQDLS
ncbi:sulfate adenylyltransferase subunit CysN [Blochmannia endosymbiont of Camponotus sp.]|uniref:sulfate adenylyltransferase subunit CysN n=1 Tax=Blochmannia endosymbiont of Camponotus sp. TaxID=700220 RepID=UPI002023CCA1|nr:sulfate adenylyltransferase subunit CysN [Blochmannia endosymbiont of Camponotus sp.]URJ24208.1 sulfate adenylyltransferase subunit CysN [Blochmannia endosymbiont of Camponotus sp.]URJ26048.1 sulfate adenylyltransferase subunit CysN [Blochmannia endosymbiont of Camponotus sp.]